MNREVYEAIKVLIEKWYKVDLKEGIISSPLQIAKSIAEAVPKKYTQKEITKASKTDLLFNSSAQLCGGFNACIDQFIKNLKGG